jgi:hypothetical protein
VSTGTANGSVGGALPRVEAPARAKKRPRGKPFDSARATALALAREARRREAREAARRRPRSRVKLVISQDLIPSAALQVARDLRRSSSATWSRVRAGA